MAAALTGAQLAEIEAAKAIFYNELEIDSTDGYHCVAEFNFNGSGRVRLKLKFPPEYPAVLPVYVPELLDGFTESFNPLEEIRAALENKFIAGKEVLFDWFTCISELAQGWDPCAPPSYLSSPEGFERNSKSLKRSQEENISDSNQDFHESRGHQKASYEAIHKKDVDKDDSIQVFHSDEPIVVKKSVFVAHLARVYSKQEVNKAMDAILADNATHNIMAYRIYDKDSNMAYEDMDDDGESTAGRKLLGFLRTLDVTNVLVVVTRWFGGIHLGPSRFRYINSCAGKLIRQANITKDSGKP